MQESEGLNLELWNENLERAKNAIKKEEIIISVKVWLKVF